MMDLISIIIPSYNRSGIVKRAVESCLAQTYGDIEIIVVDDGSTDDTEKTIKAFKSPKIVYLRHPENQGVAAARNTGIRNAKGRYVAFLDSDDEFVPEKLAAQKECFESLDPRPALIYTDIVLEERGKTRLEISEDEPSGYLKASEKHFPTNNAITGPPTWMVDRICLESVGGFDENLKIYEDRDFFIRVAAKYPVYFLNKALSIVHIPEYHLFSLGRIGLDFIKAKEVFLSKHYDWMSRDRKEIVGFYSDIADGLVKLGRKDLAREYYRKIMKIAPLKVSSFKKFIKTFF